MGEGVVRAAGIVRIRYDLHIRDDDPRLSRDGCEDVMLDEITPRAVPR